jgi:hypothetical protein
MRPRPGCRSAIAAQERREPRVCRYLRGPRCISAQGQKIRHNPDKNKWYAQFAPRHRQQAHTACSEGNERCPRDAYTRELQEVAPKRHLSLDHLRKGQLLLEHPPPHQDLWSRTLQAGAPMRRVVPGYPSLLSPPVHGDALAKKIHLRPRPSRGVGCSPCGGPERTVLIESPPPLVDTAVSRKR